ncbi:hypothetical protein JTB14_022217 [Gonioctena quinquepunctata]|nr:hypothetical protein JTB14_022217 [Gonioctena quinquepunctata]
MGYQARSSLLHIADAWKQGNLITILKAPDKDPSDPKSLRPITLLSEMGKVLERIIKYVMLSHFGEEDLFHSSQFGFRSGRSTVHAVNHLLGHVREAENHSMVIFADISGAFDNMWWPTLIKVLHERNTPAEIVSLITSYLHNRRLVSGNYTVAAEHPVAAHWLDITDKPFQRAWDLLCDRFVKKQCLLDSHFKSLLDIRGVHKESFFHFRKMLDDISKHLSSLERIDLNEDTLYDSFTKHIQCTKLERSTLREWEECRFENDSQTFEEFLEFLKYKAEILQPIDDFQHVKQSVFSKSYVHTNKINNSARVHVSVNKLICNYCKQEHSIPQCPKFLALSIVMRIQEVK